MSIKHLLNLAPNIFKGNCDTAIVKMNMMDFNLFLLGLSYPELSKVVMLSTACSGLISLNTPFGTYWIIRGDYIDNTVIFISDIQNVQKYDENLGLRTSIW